MEILPKARIYNEDTLLLGETDLEGYFEVGISKESNKLIFGFIGYEFAAVSVPDNCDYLEVILLPNVLYHYKSNQKIDRLRKKEFDKLPDLHKTAVDNRLFEMDKPCYHRQFIPIKPQLDEIGKQLKAKRKELKRSFKELAVGDTIRIPYSVSYRHDGTDRTTLSDFSYVVDNGGFDCIVEGVVVDKNKRSRGYNIVYRVTSTRLCKYDSLVYNGKDLLIKDTVRHNMKYSKLITE